MIEKEFNDRIYTKSTAKREKYTIFMLQNIGLFRVNVKSGGVYPIKSYLCVKQTNHQRLWKLTVTVSFFPKVPWIISTFPM